MSSPDVWTAARAIITDGAAALALPVAWPNETFAGVEPYAPAGTPNRWLAVEVSGDLSAPNEIGGGGWEETGSVSVHVMSPVGCGIADTLAVRKAVATWFRLQPSGAVTWGDTILDPGGMDEDGAWHRMTVRVAYAFTDH